MIRCCFFGAACAERVLEDAVGQQQIVVVARNDGLIRGLIGR